MLYIGPGVSASYYVDARSLSPILGGGLFSIIISKFLEPPGCYYSKRTKFVALFGDVDANIF